MTTHPNRLQNVPFPLNPHRWRRYEHRVIAFLDVLGFSALVSESQTNPLLVDQLWRVLDYLTRLVPEWSDPDVTNEMLKVAAEEGVAECDARKLLQLREQCERITCFSDNIVLSSTSDWSGMIFVLTSAVRVSLCCLQLGLPVRGGITVGPLLHESRVVVGPALVDAYGLESRVAGTPRVVVTKVAAKLFREAGDPFRMGMAPADLVTQDEDGENVLDFLTKTAVETAGLGKPSILLTAIRSTIVSRLTREGQPDEAKRKLRSLAQYFNRGIRDNWPDLEAIPIQSDSAEHASGG